MIGRAAYVGLALLTLAGCGDPDLWARYQAERDYWKARRTLERIQIAPRRARSQDYGEAIEAFTLLEERFPLSRWATPERLRHPRARDVAAVAGDARIAIGRIEEARGRFPRAIEVYGRAAEELASLPAARLKALLAEASVLDRTGDSTRADGLFAKIAHEYPPLDPESGELVPAALEAPLRVAGRLRARGQVAAADSVLRASEERFDVAAARQQRKPHGAELWQSLGRLRAAESGPPDAALDALRRALDEGPSRAVRAKLIMTMAEVCAGDGRPDSALVYTAWASQGFGNEVKGRAMILTAQVWEPVNKDSAIAAYSRYIDAFHNSEQSVMPARFRRAELLEQKGRWLEARAEYRGLATSSATDTLALRSLERIVSHHLAAGEKEMARIEANRALEAMDHLLTTVQDEETLLRARELRARLLLDIGSWEPAFAALADLWGRYGRLEVGVRAGFRAAELAERELADRERARRLYEELATRSPSPIDQELARRQLDRLRHERS